MRVRVNLRRLTLQVHRRDRETEFQIFNVFGCLSPSTYGCRKISKYSKFYWKYYQTCFEYVTRESDWGLATTLLTNQTTRNTSFQLNGVSKSETAV